MSVYTCSSCGSIKPEYGECPNCAKLRELKKSNEIAEQQLKFSRKQARINESIQADAENAERRREHERRQREILSVFSAEFEESRRKTQQEFEEQIKQNFSEIVLLILANDNKTIEAAFKTFCKGKFDSWKGNKYGNAMGGEFMPDRAKLYRKHLTDYIISNPNKAEVTSIVKKIFEIYAEVAKRIYANYEAAEEAKKQEAERIEDEATRAAVEKAIQEQKAAKKLSIIVRIISALIAVVSYQVGGWGIGVAIGMLPLILFGLNGNMWKGFAESLHNAAEDARNR